MIRYATRADFDQLFEMIKEMHAEQALFDFSPLKAAGAIARAIDAGCVLVADNDGKLGGSFGFATTQVWYSEETFVADMWLYVRPDRRRSMDAVRLRNALKADAQERGMTLMAGALGKKLDGARLFNRGFEKCAELFIARTH